MSKSQQQKKKKKDDLHFFWKTWEILTKFSGKMWLMAILKVTKNQGFTFSLEDTFLEKLQGVGHQIDLLPVF